MRTPSSGQDPPRRAVRVARPLEARYWSDCQPISARVDDLSELGMFLSTLHPLTVGQRVEFSLTLPDSEEEPLLGHGEVIWVEPRGGAGIEFRELSAEQHDRLRYFIAAVYFGHVE